MRVPARLLAVVLLGLLALPALAAKERTGPDSFVPYRAYTVDELVAQVESDVVVCQRLAKHFHVSQADLVKYLRDNIQVITFSESGWRPVYGVTRTGRIYKSRDYFRKGGKVFGLSDGTPLMKYACANPIVTELPTVAPVVTWEAPSTHAPEEYTQVVSLPVAPTFEMPSATAVHCPEEYTLLVELPRAAALEVPLAQAVEAGKRGFPAWPLAAGIPLLEHHHGIIVPRVIPEPTSILLLAGGLAVLGGLRRRRHS